METMNTRLTVKQAAEFLGVSEPTLYKWRREGKGPRYVKLGKITYYKDDLLKYIEECTTEIIQ